MPEDAIADQWVMLEDPEPTEREKMFADAHRKATERIEQFEERVLTVIRAHLGAEQSLNALMKAGRRRRKGRTCSGKWWVAKGLFVKEMTEELWEVLKVGNELRNAIAHGDKPGLIEAKPQLRRRAGCPDRTAQEGRGHRRGRHATADRPKPIGRCLQRACDRSDSDPRRSRPGMALTKRPGPSDLKGV
jgi:hypothetical protein